MGLGDWADRNFLIKGNSLYSIDEHGEILIDKNKALNLLGVKKYNYCILYVKKYKEEINSSLLPYLEKVFYEESEDDESEDSEESKISVTYRNEISWNGYPLDILKSGLQKSIRRCNVEDAVYYATELDLFSLVDGGERVRTNMIHRLMIIFLEDIGTSEPCLIYRISDGIFKLLDYRKERIGMVINSENFNDIRDKEIGILLEIVALLCISKHCRELSYYKNVFYDCLKEIPCSKKIREKFSIFKEMGDARNEDFVSLLKKKNPLCIEKAFKIHESEEKFGKFYGCSKAPYYIFHLLETMIKNKELGEDGDIDYLNLEKILKVSISWFKELSPIKEDFLCWEFVILCILKNNTYDKSDILSMEFDMEELIKMYDRNKNFEKIEIKDYVMDMHTKAGKKKKTRAKEREREKKRKTFFF
jgi:hypothetical protein